MNTYILTEDQQMVQDLARSISKAEIQPISEAIDHRGAYSPEGIKILADSGLIACCAAEEFGGSEQNARSQICVLEEVAAECASTAWTIALCSEIAECVEKSAAESIKKTVISDITGGELATLALNSDISVIKTDNGYLLNGAVYNVPNAEASKWYLLSAKLEDKKVWFVLNRNTPGITIGKSRTTLGFKGCPISQLSFESVLVDEQYKLEADITDLLDNTMALDMAAIAVGISRGAMNNAITYVNERTQFGKTIAQFVNTQQVLTELQSKIEAAGALVRSAADVKDAGLDYTNAASMAKLFASDAACDVTRKCVQFMGGYGYSREYPVERKMRDAKMTELCGGMSIDLKTKLANNIVILK